MDQSIEAKRTVFSTEGWCPACI